MKKNINKADVLSLKHSNSGIFSYLCYMLIGVMLLTPKLLMANPQGGQVAAGQATIRNSSKVTTIQQSSDKAIIDWQRFNIKSDELTQFKQPNSDSVTLNRVNAKHGASQIYGRITANGRIILINPAGILFGATSRVDVGGLIATTANIRDEDFLNDHYFFQQSSQYPNSTVINKGHITIKNGGLAALVAPGVENHGIIEANTGTVILGSGKQYTIDFYGDGLLHFGVGAAIDEAPVDGDGNQLNHAVSNSGRIIADGGRVQLTARVAENVVDHAINMSGYIRANTVQQRGGEIIITAGNTGRVRVSGTIEARGVKTGDKGGKVKIAGKQVDLVEQAKIDVSGSAGGGMISIGRDLDKPQDSLTADNISIGSDTLLLANAIDDGNGGTITALAETSVEFYGYGEARGGQFSGDGGFVEVSGDQVTYAGLFNTLAPQGDVGLVFLDPDKIIVTNITRPDEEPQLVAASQVVTQLLISDFTLMAKDEIAVVAAIDASLNSTSNNLTLIAPLITLSNSIILAPGALLLGNAINQTIQANSVLQNAFDVAGDGARINLINRIYSESNTTLTENLTITKNNLRIIGVDNLLSRIDGTGLASAILNIADNIVVSIENVVFINGAAGALSIGDNAQVTLDNLLFTNNSAESGGAILNNGGDLTITNSTFTGNQATGNQATDGGGAIMVRAGGDLTVNNSTFTNNRADINSGDGGAIALENMSVADISMTTFEGNTALNGGAISVDDSILNVDTSSFIQNQATGDPAMSDGQGGAVSSRMGILTFINNTFSSNDATFQGGAFANLGGTQADFISNTFTRNTARQGGGLQTAASGDIRLKNNIIAENSVLPGGVGGPDVLGTFNSQGNNLIGIITGGEGFILGSDLFDPQGNPIDPMLSPLGDFGGPTRTHNLLAGSPAIDAGNNIGVSNTDQRGFVRIQDGNNDGASTVDIGAVEFNVINTNDSTITVDRWLLFAREVAGVVLLELNDINFNEIASKPAEFVEAVFINGSDSNNILIVSDFSLIPEIDIFYNAMGGFDQLGIPLTAEAETATNIIYTLTGLGMGSINVDGTVINFTGLIPMGAEPNITDVFIVANRTFNYVNSVADIISLSRFTMDGLNSLNSPQSTNITFSNPSSDLFINTSQTPPSVNNDMLTINSIDPLFSGNLDITGDDKDNVTVLSDIGEGGLNDIFFDIPSVSLDAVITMSPVNGSERVLEVNVLSPSASIQQAMNIAAEGATVNVAAGTYFETELTTTTNNLSIIGAGAGLTILDAQSQLNERLFLISQGITQLISGFTFTDGLGAGDGGALLNLGVLTIMDALFTNNTADFGGAISNLSGTLTISNSQFINNTAQGGGGFDESGNGGAIFNDNGQLSINDNTIFRNNTALSSGGAIRNQMGSVTIEQSQSPANQMDTFFMNNTADFGGAISNFEGTLIVSGAQFVDNTAQGGGGVAESGNGGAIFNDGGQVSITNNSLFQGNTAQSSGGAIRNVVGSVTINQVEFKDNQAEVSGGAISQLGTAQLTVTHSLFRDNVATSESGGAIHNNGGNATITTTQFNSNNTGGLGGAIRNLGILTIDESSFTDNQAFGAGAIGQDATAQLTVTNSTFTNNRTTDGGGGAIGHFGNGGMIDITNTQFIDNVSEEGVGAATFEGVGGALFVAGNTTVNVEGGSFIGNSAAITGGAIFNTNNANAFTISGTTFSNNSTTGQANINFTRAGAIFNRDGMMEISNALFTNNTGGDVGAIVNELMGSLTISSSAIAKNSGGQVGGILNAVDASLTMTNSTISNNTATEVNSVGGLQNNSVGAVSLVNVTVAENSGLAVGGVDATQPVTLQNTLIANNTGTNPDVSGAFDSLGNNLIGDTSGGSGFVASDITNVDPLIGPLADNGGNTLTHRLLIGSPAIDAGNNAGAVGDFDQRSEEPFFRIQDGSNQRVAVVDIGALEFTVINTDRFPNVDNWTLSRVGNNGETLKLINSDTQQTLFEGPFAFFDAVYINGNINPNTLTVDFSQGIPIPSSIFEYSGAGPFVDALSLINGTVDSIRHVFDGLGNGFVAINNQFIDYTQIASISDTLIARARELIFLPLTSIGLNHANRDDIVITTSNGQTVLITQPTDSLFIQAGGDITQQVSIAVNDDIIIDSVQGGIEMGSATQSLSRQGSIRYHAANNIGLAVLLAPQGDVSVISDTGSVFDNNGAALNIQALSDFLLSAMQGQVATATAPLDFSTGQLAVVALGGIFLQSSTDANINDVSVTTQSLTQQFSDGVLQGIRSTLGGVSLVANEISTSNRANQIVGSDLFLVGQNGVGLAEKPVFIEARQSLTVGGFDGGFLLGALLGDSSGTAAEVAQLTAEFSGAFFLNNCLIPFGCKITNVFTTLDSVWQVQNLYHTAYYDSFERAEYRLCDPESDEYRFTFYQYFTPTENTCTNGISELTKTSDRIPIRIPEL